MRRFAQTPHTRPCVRGRILRRWGRRLQYIDHHKSVPRSRAARYTEGNIKKYVAEAIGTFTLVFFGCATMIFMKDEVGLLGVALAFGLSFAAMAYTFGHVSEAHLNPAVSTGALFAGRRTTKATDL